MASARADVICRQVAFRSTEGDGGGNGRTLRGLAVPFNEITHIDNPWEGTFDEQFAFGAFKRTLSHKTPKLQFDHGTHPLMGSLPIGTFDDLREEEEGLRVEATIFDNWLTHPLRDAVASDAIDGMSIRFRPVRTEITAPEDRDDGGYDELRTIVEAELIELGPVVFPVYSGTDVDLRSYHGDLTSQIERERLARALLADPSKAEHEPSILWGQSTGSSEALSLVFTVTDSATSGYSDSPCLSGRTRARRARLHEYH